MSRRATLRAGLAIVVVGLVLAWVALMLRILRVAPHWEISGRTATKSYPLVVGFIIAAAIVLVIGAIVELVGLMMRPDRPPGAQQRPLEAP